MADTALTLITDALLDMGIIADGQTPTAAQSSQALRKLNQMLESWEVEGLMVYGATPLTLPLVSNQATYTIGVGGDLDVAYPNNIQSAFIRDTSVPQSQQIDYQLYVFNNQEWAQNPLKYQANSFPYWGVWFDMTYPLITLHVSPIPTTGQYEIIIWTDNNLSQLTLSSVIEMPAGYKRAIVSNLCIELAGSYQVPLSESIISIARDGKARIKTSNLQINEITPSFGDIGIYNIYTNKMVY